jgi:hypothetical protein
METPTKYPLKVQESIAEISDIALLKRLRASEPWLRLLTAKMTDLEETGVIQRLSPQRRLRAVDATTVEEQGGAGARPREDAQRGAQEAKASQ